MDKDIKQRLMKELQSEADLVSKNEKDKNIKLKKLNDIFNILKILENFEELEPTIAKYFAEKAQRDKYSEPR